MATQSSILAWRIPGTGAWWAAIYGVAQSRTWLMWFSSSSSSRVMDSNILATKKKTLQLKILQCWLKHIVWHYAFWSICFTTEFWATPIDIYFHSIISTLINSRGKYYFLSPRLFFVNSNGKEEERWTFYLLIQILSSQNISTKTFGFISVQQIFLQWIMLNSICTFFLTHGLFWSLLLSFQIFEDFLDILLLSVSNLILS